MLSRFSRVRLFMTPWTVAHQAALSTEFSRQEYWSGLPCPSPGDLADPRIEHVSPVAPSLQTDSLPLSTGEAQNITVTIYYTVHGVLQARILEWVTIPFSRGSFQPRDRTQVSHIAGRFFTS